MKKKSRLILPYEKPRDHEVGINPGTDYLRECPRCGEFRHTSWFHVGQPACAHCMQFEKVYIEELSKELMRRDPLHLLPEPSPKKI